MVAPGVVHTEPYGIAILEPFLACKIHFHRAILLQFFERFQGHNAKVKNKFTSTFNGETTSTFNGETTRVGDITLTVQRKP